MRHWSVCSLVAAVAAASLPAAAAEKLTGPFVAEVTEVTDGDTLKVRVPVWLDFELNTSVRLRGIDTPELHAQCQREKDMALAARELLRKETTPRVILRNVEGDKYYGRVEADVTTLPDELDLSQAMLASGLARPYDGGKRGDWCDLASLGR
jgi:endonuclease YncB( thermonuclease family)